MEDTPFEAKVFSRDMIVAPPGYILVAADIDQADARVLAQMIDSFPVDTETHKRSLLRQRESMLGPAIGRYLPWLDVCRNRKYRGTSPIPPRHFDPNAPSWMVAEPRVRVLLTYRNSHRYWYDVVPLRPGLRTLTCFIKRVWSVDNRARPKLIYTDQRGRIGTKWYEQLDRGGLLYHLPIRNLPWSNIRRVQRVDSAGQPVEEAKYEGMFATSRSAINAIMQGGTMDVITQMMLRSRPVVEAFNARLILQIHDELVWEVPYARCAEFIFAMKGVLQQPPSAGFRIPVLVGFKRGFRFGRVEGV
ncbi:MAG: hypothetical protein HQ582_08000 [Planctomycetes bacterium]|nr:hypothetical protein [Planctomycetota bacterium]